MSSAWDYEGYWNAVIGAHLSAKDAVRDFDLTRSTASDWVIRCEADAWDAGNLGGPVPPEWAGFRRRAIEELERAAAALDSTG